MKTIIKTSLLVCCALLLAGCTADEIETDKKTKTPDIPEGATLFESIAQPETPYCTFCVWARYVAKSRMGCV